jgi:hypothetical protein
MSLLLAFSTGQINKQSSFVLKKKLIFFVAEPDFEAEEDIFPDHINFISCTQDGKT